MNESGGGDGSRQDGGGGSRDSVWENRGCGVYLLLRCACVCCVFLQMHLLTLPLLLLPQLKKGEKLPLLPVWVVDLDTMTWTSLVTTGDIPTARGGHTVRALGGVP